MVALPYVLGHSHVHIHTHAYSRGVEALVIEPSGPDFITWLTLHPARKRGLRHLSAYPTLCIDLKI